MPEPRPDAPTALLPSGALAATANWSGAHPPPGGAPRADADDLRVLLRSRLRFVAHMCAGALVVTSLFALTAGDAFLTDTWSYTAVAVFALGAGVAVVLWRCPDLSVRRLRALELVLFGGLYVQWATVHAFLYPRFVIADPPLWFGFLVGYAVCLPWALMAIAYGILIPNTWRRCAAVVGVMSVTPLVISVATGMGARATAGHSLGSYLLVVGACMGWAAALAVHGSHRIEGLRRAAVAARQLGAYALQKKLGTGGMGEVWLAEHRLLKRPCAVKFVRADLAANPATAARFAREVQAVTGLTHFNTVRIYDYGQSDDGSFYYVMEYLDGPTLDALVQHAGPLAPGRAVHLLRQLCGALAEAHAAGLVHRDLKPGNVIVATLGGQPDVVKLLDFGLVQDLSLVDGAGRLTQAGVVMGTPAYMCPEQAGGAARVDARGDLYALGAVGFFVLTGRPPFERATVGGYIAAHLTEPAPAVTAVNPDVPADLAAVVAKCLAKDPAARFQSAAELDAALAACRCAADRSPGAGARVPHAVGEPTATFLPPGATR